MELNVFAEKGFIHVIGPSPAIVPAGGDAWDGRLIESCDIFKDEDTYHWYYHGLGDETYHQKGYRVGVATAPSPLGPWTRFEGNPILDYGADGEWDDGSVDCVCVMKEGSYDLLASRETVALQGKFHRPQKPTYYMWYSGGRMGKPGSSIGLATANSPFGPWRKYEGNPIVEDFGYLGSVVKANGTFYMYTEYPVGTTDQGPLCVATAKRPEGPWKKYQRNPILSPGDWGAWDDGGYSEAGVRYNDGAFHLFYGGAKTWKLESIGYARSSDGFTFMKYPGNPVVALRSVPDASGFAEVKSLIEPPFIYLYHTLRYFHRHKDEDGRWLGEDLGIQILTANPTFRIPMPVITLGALDASGITTPEQCIPIGMQNVSGCAITVECGFEEHSRSGLRLHLRSSFDGISWDSRDMETINIVPAGGKVVQQTVACTPNCRFFKVLCENLDSDASISPLNITVTLCS